MVFSPLPNVLPCVAKFRQSNAVLNTCNLSVNVRPRNYFCASAASSLRQNRYLLCSYVRLFGPPLTLILGDALSLSGRISIFQWKREWESLKRFSRSEVIGQGHMSSVSSGQVQWPRQDLLRRGAKMEIMSWGTHGGLQGQVQQLLGD